MPGNPVYLEYGRGRMPGCPMICQQNDNTKKYDIKHWATIPRQYLGGFNHIAMGCGKGCEMIDQQDFNAFEACWTGPAVPWSYGLAPSCQP